MTKIAGAVLIFLAVYAAVRGGRHLVRGLREATSLEVVRGIRWTVFAVVASIFALGVLTMHTGFFVLGIVFLAEELYETGVVSLAIRWGYRCALDEGSVSG
jgi:hypothetical protein